MFATLGIMRPTQIPSSVRITTLTRSNVLSRLDAAIPKPWRSQAAKVPSPDTGVRPTVPWAFWARRSARGSFSRL